MQDRKVHDQVLLQVVRQQENDREDHGRGAHHRRADQHRFGRGLEGIARAVVLFQVMLGLFEVHVEPEFLLELAADAGNLFDLAQLIHALRVVGHRTVGIHGDGHRPHAQESERHQTEREYRRRLHQRIQPQRADAVADGHQAQHRHAQPIGAEVARHQPGQNVERRAALPRRCHHFPHMRRIDGGEHLHQLRNNRAGQRAAGDDRG